MQSYITQIDGGRSGSSCQVIKQPIRHPPSGKDCRSEGPYSAELVDLPPVPSTWCAAGSGGSAGATAPSANYRPGGQLRPVYQARFLPKTMTPRTSLRSHGRHYLMMPARPLRHMALQNLSGKEMHWAGKQGKPNVRLSKYLN
jgi:hypothetical protein